jgi:hypothetical protein
MLFQCHRYYYYYYYYYYIIIIIIIIIRSLVSFKQGIYAYIPKTRHAAGEYSVAAML